MFKSNRRVITWALGLCVGVLAAIGSPALAHADDSGGIGGGGDQSGSSTWHVSYATSPGKPYSDFRDDWFGSIRVGANGNIINTAGKDIGLSDSVCRNSLAIWWITFNNHGKFDGGGPGYWIGGNDVVTTLRTFGGVPQDLANRASTWAGANGYNDKHTVAICSGYFQERTGVDRGRQYGSTSDKKTFTAPVSWSSVVTREISDSSGKDPIGKNNLNNQPAVSKTSGFGALVNGMATGSVSKSNYNAIKAKAEEAVAKDASSDHPEVTLNADNQAGLAEGGVLSVSEYTARRTVSVSASESYYHDWECNWIQKWDTKKNGWGAKTVTSCPKPKLTTVPTFENANGWKLDEGSYKASTSAPTQQATGFYQILSVHCNPAELNALLDAINGEQIVSQTAGVDGKSTTVLYTKRYADRAQATHNDGLLGSTLSTLPTAVQRTGELGFYDKECDLTCVAYPSVDRGASSANGANVNVPTGTNQGGKDFFGGAVLNDDVNSSYFEIFRDNDDRELTVNAWYPRNDDAQFKYGGSFPNAGGSGNVTIPASAPISTTITRWVEGTPSTSGDEGGQFSMVAVSPSGTRKAVFQNGSDKPATQTNFGANPYQSVDSTTLDGFYRSLIVKATWASEVNRPQVFNVKWEYQPTVWTRFPSSVGFTSASAADIASYAVRDQAVDGRCYSFYGSSDRDLDLANRVHESTGTGTTNVLDAGLLEGANGDASWMKQSNLVLKFVRAVSE